MDNNLLTDLAFLNNSQDEPIDPELYEIEGAIKPFNSSPIRVTKQKKSNNDKFKVLSSDEIVQYVQYVVDEVNSILQLKSTVTRMILSYCKWDKILLMEKFYNDPEKLFNEARVINPFHISTNDTTAEAESNECEICYSELSSGSTASNACGHRFCTTCWSAYLKVKIMDEGVGNSILCAATDCDFIIDDETVIKLVDDLQAKLRYQHLITNSFVQQNLLLRWCPAPGCSFAVKVDFSSFKPISCTCKCGHEFCFDCIEEWHGPVPCDILKRFKAHLVEGIFNQRTYLPGHFGYEDKIKTCPNPNCLVSIQKIYGCHVMQCKNCSTIFCWECLNRYKTKAAVYQHLCKGEQESKDSPKSTETKEENGDDSEMAPPQKYVKLSTVAGRVPEQNDNESVGAELNLLQKMEAALNDENRGRNQENDKKETEEQPEGDAEQQAQEDEEPHFLGFEQLYGPAQRLNLNVMNYRQPEHEAFVNEHEQLLRRIDRRMLRFPRRHINFLNRPGFGNHRNAYYQKYMTEDANFRAAVTQLAQIKEFLQRYEEKPEDLVQFESALNLITQCRKTLKYSAVFTMYLKNVNNWLLFKSLLLDLEVATNDLAMSTATVNIVAPDTYVHIPGMVIPAYRNCQRRRRALLDYIDEGYDNEWWLFDEQPTEIER